jgi:pimeloyl-ACP methyl ester carboxylesterase
MPTLVTSGHYDEATPTIAGTVYDGIPGSQWILFEKRSHMPHTEEPERYMQVLNEFFTAVESQVAAAS